MAIEVDHLVKRYRVHHKEAGLRGSVRNLFHRQYEIVQAVNDVSFRIKQGEIVGFLGGNGAGKTTTLKCLAGLLVPTSGHTTVLGFRPHEREKAFLRQIGFVMGQRNQLLWDLPPMETFLVNQAIYDVPDDQFRRTLDRLIELLGLGPLLTKQVRLLSLGERMKCELTAALLHQPSVLFLDEPTLGLDLAAQIAIRDFIRAYNQQSHVTVLLTSHYLADVTALSKRILVIDYGKLIYDGDLYKLVEQMAPYKLLRLTLRQPLTAAELSAFGEIECIDRTNVLLRIPRNESTDIIVQALTTLPVLNVDIEELALERIILEMLHSGK